MSKLVNWTITTDTAAATEAVAEKIGHALKGSEAIELVGDLGGGKTTFVRGLVRGLGSKDKVASPTFTISKVYQAGDLEVHHFDFYRLADAGVVAHELSEVVGDPTIIVVVEWGNVVRHVLPNKRLTLSIKQTPEGKRELHFTCPAELQYVQKATI